MDTGEGLSAGVIAGIVIGSCLIVILLLIILRLTGYLGGKDDENNGKTINARNICVIITYAFDCYFLSIKKRRVESVIVSVFLYDWLNLLICSYYRTSWTRTSNRILQFKRN